MVSLFKNAMEYLGFHCILRYFTMVYLFQNTVVFYHGIRWYIFITVNTAQTMQSICGH